jgi:hypothetical protein
LAVQVEACSDSLFCDCLTAISGIYVHLRLHFGQCVRRR